MSIDAAETPSPPAESRLPIRTVSMLTGVNAITLRAWERRYGLIIPGRTAKGHRLYTDQDVERIRQIVGLLDQGVSVGQVKPLLERMYAPAVERAAEGETDVWNAYQDKMLGAIERFDQRALDSTYNDALSLYPVDIVIRHLTVPLLHALGERWRQREAGIAEEHFFSVYLRNKLGTRIHHVNQQVNGPWLLLACLPGEQHDMGLLLFALAAVDAGYGVVLLGANTPLTQILPVLDKKRCAGVVLSAISKPARGVLETELPELTHRLDIPVFIGGNVADSHHDRLEATGAVYVGGNISEGLQRINKALRRGR